VWAADSAGEGTQDRGVPGAFQPQGSHAQMASRDAGCGLKSVWETTEYFVSAVGSTDGCPQVWQWVVSGEQRCAAVDHMDPVRVDSHPATEAHKDRVQEDIDCVACSGSSSRAEGVSAERDSPLVSRP
jgi:hypothetical protein